MHREDRARGNVHEETGQWGGWSKCVRDVAPIFLIHFCEGTSCYQKYAFDPRGPPRPGVQKNLLPRFSSTFDFSIELEHFEDTHIR